MDCPNCGAEIGTGQHYCGQCGTKARADTLGDIREQLESLRLHVEELRRARATEQRFLELDTSEKVMTRVMKWIKLIGFYVGIPVILILAIVSFFVGKELKSLYDIAGSAREAVKPILEVQYGQARRKLFKLIN